MSLELSSFEKAIDSLEKSLDDYYDKDTAERVFCNAKEFLPYAKNLLNCLKERNE